MPVWDDLFEQIAVKFHVRTRSFGSEFFMQTSFLKLAENFIKS